MATHAGSIKTTVKSEATRVVTHTIDIPEDDPVVSAFLSFLEDDMKKHPERIARLSKRTASRAIRLTKGVRVSDNDRLPGSVTF